jgi:hypothetical protein
MVYAPDMRIPVLFTKVSGAEAYLVEGDAPVPAGAYVVRFTLPARNSGHVIGCHCCTPRGPAADALAAMFRARATGSAPFFSQVAVLASEAGEAVVRAAIEEDLIASARYKISI